MPKFLKRYWPNIVFVVVLSALLFFFIPTQEKHYLQPDIDAIRKKARVVLIWTESILAAILLIIVLKELKKISELFNTILGLVLLGLPFYFFFQSIFVSAAFFLNQLSAGKQVNKQYQVTYYDPGNNWLSLFDNATQESFLARSLDLSKNTTMRSNDTITISFRKGLLGFNFDPVIQPR